MTVIDSTQTEREQISHIIAKDIPSYRDAYSDRTAWLMACFSELAYVKFNPFPLGDSKQMNVFKKAVEKVIKNEKKKSVVSSLVSTLIYDHSKEEQKLINDLGLLNYKLVKPFDNEGTQAFIAANDAKKLLVLAFRGTEATSIRDIKADINARTVPTNNGGKAHKGFTKAYQAVSAEVQDFINQDTYKDYRLFITGHSLGGALASMAAKNLYHRGGIAACYTFGSPRVGTIEWTGGLRSSIYRFVNATDCVTLMPPGGTAVSAIAYLLDSIAFGKGLAKILRHNFSSYLHCGDMRYLTNCTTGQYDDVELLPYVGFFWRLMAMIKSGINFSAVFADHSITIYRKKIGIIAVRHTS